MPAPDRTWPRAILFDFDGVIVNSEPLHFYAFQETLAAERIELTEAEYYRDLLGFDDKGVISHVFAARGKKLDPPTYLRVFTRKKETMMDLIHRRKYAALPGVERFVRGLWRDYPLAICSGALRDEIEAMLEGVALRDCFKVIVAAEDVSAPKPDPQGYMMAMKQLTQKAGTKLTPADCLVVEDSAMVVRSVRAAGFPVLAVATSTTVERLSDANWAVPSLDPDVVNGTVPGLRLAKR